MDDRPDEMDVLVASLKGPTPPAHAPPIPRIRRWPFAVAGLGLAVAAGFLFWPGPQTTPRGAAGQPAFDLRLAVERDGVAYRVSRGETYHVGDTVYFRIAATPVSRAVLQVEGPGGRETVATLRAGPTPEDVQVDGQTVAWRFDAPGTWTFRLSDGEGPGTTVDVEVR